MPTPGTYCTYQGYPLLELVFVRARGFSANGAEMVIAASAFPAGFTFEAPDASRLLAAASPSGEARLEPANGPVPPATRLAFEGFLEMAEVDAAGQVFRHPPVRLFVTRVETQRDGGAVKAVKVVAVDDRFFWDHGRLSRWSFNRRMADGRIALDSVKDNGQPLNRREIAAGYVCRALFRAPRLAAAPADWTTNTGAIEFGPHAPPAEALKRLVDEHDLEDPCLRIDGSVALHKPGNGFFGYASQPGGANDREFPPALRLDKQGQGQGDVVEFTYAEDWVVIVGGPTVVTVAIDDCEPVVIYDDVVWVLNEQNVRRLTGGRYGLDWLTRWVFAPSEWAGPPDIPEGVADVLRTQAGRLYRVPGVEIERDTRGDILPANPQGPEAEGDAAADIAEQRANDALDDRLRSQAAGGRVFGPDPSTVDPGPDIVREPGPNAHLMPMLPRAEVVAGKRLPVTVETYRFTARNRNLRGANAVRVKALQLLNDLRKTIIANSAGKNPFSGSGTAKFGEVDFSRLFSYDDVFRARFEAGISVGEVLSYVGSVRQVKRIENDTSGQFAAQYDRLLGEQYAAADAEDGGYRSVLYELAKKFVEAETRARQAAFGVDVLAPGEGQGDFRQVTQSEFFRSGEGEKLRGEIVAAMREVLRRKEERRRRDQLGVEATDNGTQVFYVNGPRVVDAGARVVDEERGIFECGGLAGHLVLPDIHDVSHPDAQLKLAPVRVLFGATLRPRVDVPYSQAARPRTGGQPDPDVSVESAPGGQTIIPSILRDEESTYVAAFRRLANGKAERVPLALVPNDQCLVIRRPEMVRLVPLEGESNESTLDLQAEQLAAELFKARPVVRSQRAVVARPWCVQCDGVVSQVTIRLRPGGKGFETEVLSGNDRDVEGVGPTQVRPSAGDSAARERLTT